MTIHEIKEKLVGKYKEGKDCNEGGLGTVNNVGWEGLLVGFFMNLTIGLNPVNFDVVKIRDSITNKEWGNR